MYGHGHAHTLIANASLLIVNTSFDVRGARIVCTPEDPFRCFMGSNIETLAVENYLLIKEEQEMALRRNYKDQYELD